MGTVVDPDDKKAFASNYLLVNPDVVGLKGMFHILTSRKGAKKRRYIDTPKDNIVVDGWLLFLSIVLQKMLKLVSTPMAWMGAIIELWLNLLSNNGGFLGLIHNILRFRAVIPDTYSPNYLSVVAHLDERVDIDGGIKHGKPKYYEALSLLASKIAYENKAYIQNVVENRWKMELLGAFDFWNDYLKKPTTHAFIMRERTCDSEIIMVAFGGTAAFNADEWCASVDLSWYKIPGVGKIHAGFMKAMGMQKNRGWPMKLEQDPNRPPVAYYYIREVLRKLLGDNSRARFIVTGHGTGGALAILFPSILALHDQLWMLERLDSVYTYGQPRVGDGKFGKFVQQRFKEHGVRYVRFVYCNDVVPRVPFDDSGRMFKHFGVCLYYNSFYRGEIVAEEPFKNYFSIFGVIPMTVNAGWEIIRGFIYPYKKGSIYRENWFLFSVRLFGLLLPGLPAHTPQDYDNSTRLGSLVSRIQLNLDNKI